MRRSLLGVVAALAAAGALAATARSEAPRAPMSTVMGAGVPEVTFDHAIHAGKYGMPCLDCHAFAHAALRHAPAQRNHLAREVKES